MYDDVIYSTTLILVCLLLLSNVRKKFNHIKEMKSEASMLLKKLDEENMLHESVLKAVAYNIILFDRDAKKVFIDTHENIYSNSGIPVEESHIDRLSKCKENKIVFTHFDDGDGIDTVSMYQMKSDEYCILLYTFI